jgi:hypothetical protein
LLLLEVVAADLIREETEVLLEVAPADIEHQLILR